MSDVLVRGMKMPKSCSQCICTVNVCKLWKRVAKRTRERHPDCPLVEVEIIAEKEAIIPINMIGGYLEKVGGSEE